MNNKSSLKVQKFRLFLEKNKLPAKIIFFLTGIFSTIWFLVRVIPKPSRATYPCMQATAPVMAGFVAYLLSLGTTVFAIKKMRSNFSKSRYAYAFLFLFVAIVAFTTNLVVQKQKAEANINTVDQSHFIANEPIGVARGIIPGRVVWAHNANATNENLVNQPGDYWYMSNNADQDVIDELLELAIKKVADKATISEAWDAIFKHFNNAHDRGDVGYTAGEKIAIKINLTNSCCNMNGTEKTKNKERMDATPQLVLSLLRQLVDVAGVAEDDITIGDPYRPFRNEYWDLCHTEFPDVHYIDGHGINGRDQTEPSTDALVHFADGEYTSRIPQHYIDATYFINMPCLKSHDAGGITLLAKNHQGSIIEDGDLANKQSAFFMHYSLPGESPGYKKFRHILDCLGHEHIGGKSLISILDAIWAGDNWEGNIFKWQMAPFNNDYPSSVFVSLDQVALESVGYDFLLTEYQNKSGDKKYPYMEGADDYILQAADPANWPDDITYDPENDGTPLTSLGVHEHWNNETDKQYSRNLGTGNGIELVYVNPTITGVSEKSTDKKANAFTCYPNPFTNKITFEIPAALDKTTNLIIYNMSGKAIKTIAIDGKSNKVYWTGCDTMGKKVANGTYLYVLHDNNNEKLYTGKITKK